MLMLGRALSIALMNKLKRASRIFLDYSRTDRSAIILLSLLIVVCVAANFIIGRYAPSNPPIDPGLREKWQKMVASTKASKKTNTMFLFPFDPNIITVEELDSLLLPKQVKRNLIRYRETGGRFKRKRDLRKIYGVNDSVYSSIDSLILLPEESPAQTYKKETNFNKEDEKQVQSQGLNRNFEKKYEKDDRDKGREIGMVNLNRADTSELRTLPGIGPVFAGRIIKYRKLLGGFYEKEQLLEVYNFPEESFRVIEKRVSVDSSSIRKIRLNFSEYGDLLRHPYLEKEAVEAILKYRRYNGSIEGARKLKDITGMKQDDIDRLLPYLQW